MSINSSPERLDNSHEVQEVRASELSSEHTSSFDSSSTFPMNDDSSNPCMRSSACSSLRHIPTVKFAPLPSPDPSRKRRSVQPLGVAARSRRPRPVRDVVEQRQSLWANDPAADPLLEDPLFTLGKFVKSASKSLWQRIRKRSGLSGQVQPTHHYTDVILDTRSAEEQEHRQAIVNPEKGVGACFEQAPDNVDTKGQWRRSTGNMPSVPGLH
ncbi:hypothetical protein K503DRAFT_854570 [Rhizopogon vinicolor AM-OR11-026]|uniref:Uncharacterized protein n=1 Tax=Rhizopogon vinicolor AM-OR11-026 TaxID=1314800 RepID=A0A1B7N9L8_9AGAM|nr:hypothetical protein K503DRAFT_854570 [Rhizopogon vinicolor AM-OR11-026]